MSKVRMLTPGEVARTLNVTVNTLRRWRNDKQGPPYIAMGERTVRYPADEFQRWLEIKKQDADLNPQLRNNPTT